MKRNSRPKKKMPLKLKIILISVATVVFLSLVIKISRAVVSSANSAESVTYTVLNETYENVIEIAGTVSAAKEQTLKSLNDGTVVGVYKEEGDSVKEGDLIVQLDDTEQVYNLANLDYEISVARQNQTAGKLKLMETQRESLVRKVSDRKIVATFDGIIADLDVDPGDYLEAKDSIGTLVDTSYLTAEVEIAETDVSKLKAEQKVIFSFPAYEEEVEGYLVSYPAIGEVTSRGATVVYAKVRIDNVPEGILPNFSFTGKIQITEPEERIIVERLAIGYEQGKAFVEIIEGDGKLRKRTVRVESYGTDYVKILEGLSGGEVLKAQSTGERSGRMRVNSRGGHGAPNSSGGNNRNAGGGPMGGGMPPR